jgi:hypothetical protein
MRMSAECGGASAVEATGRRGSSHWHPRATQLSAARCPRVMRVITELLGVRAPWPVTPRRTRRPCACARCMRCSSPSTFIPNSPSHCIVHDEGSPSGRVASSGRARRWRSCSLPRGPRSRSAPSFASGASACSAHTLDRFAHTLIDGWRAIFSLYRCTRSNLGGVLRLNHNDLPLRPR